MKAGKDRIIEADSPGVLSNQNAAVKLEDLPEQEQKPTAELASIGEKAAIREEWLYAPDKLSASVRLTLFMSRRILSTIFATTVVHLKKYASVMHKCWVVTAACALGEVKPGLEYFNSWSDCQQM